MCMLKAQLKLLFVLIVAAQISWVNADTKTETKIKMVQGQLVLPNREVQITTGRSRYDEDLEALSKVGQVKVIGRDNRQCVTYARAKTGKPVYGLARLNPTNSAYPQVGAVVKTNESKSGHLAVVVAETYSTITIREANYRHGFETERVLLKTDGRILGYVI